MHEGWASCPMEEKTVVFSGSNPDVSSKHGQSLGSSKNAPWNLLRLETH